MSFQSRRDCTTQPRVARNELPWVHIARISYPERVSSWQLILHGTDVVSCPLAHGYVTLFRRPLHHPYLGQICLGFRPRKTHLLERFHHDMRDDVVPIP